MRSSKQRDAVLEVLQKSCDHPTADVIYERVKEIIPNISLGTVYRNLSTLIESGEIISVETSDKCVFYDGFIKDHAHFVCKECKNIFDFELPTSAKEHLAGDGFDVSYERLVCYGTCKNCLKK
jgi:Fe2+ or Zn2+ uptake regulation protein